MLRENFDQGFRFAASFDLTAFYDSIDHTVLKSFLREIGIDEDIIYFLIQCLQTWSSFTWTYGKTSIYHNHGIPQGPLCSGMLSEVILQHIDRVGERPGRDVRYLRYVDDIKLMAKSEEALRRRLVILDLASKEVGLFPQGSKIAIREIKDVDAEFKSVSVPPEPALRDASDQNAIRNRVRELANRGRPDDPTRFRFNLAALKPTARSNKLILQILQLNPHLAPPVVAHLGRYKRLPPTVAENLIRHVTTTEVYHSVNAELLELLFDRVSGANAARLATFAYDRLFATRPGPSRTPRPQPTYLISLVRWALLSGRMTFADFEGVLKRERDWWVTQQCLRLLTSAKFGPASFNAILNMAARLDDPEVSRTAAAMLFDGGGTIQKPFSQIHLSARLLLRTTNLIPSAGRPPSLINGFLSYVLKQPTTAFSWPRFFGANHAMAERIAIVAKQRYETDIDAFVVSFDSFCDQLIQTLYGLRSAKPMTTAYGNALRQGAPAWLRKDFPTVLKGFTRLHGEVRPFDIDFAECENRLRTLLRIPLVIA